MRLSMWMLCEWLAGYAPKQMIVEGGRSLRNARLLPSGAASLSKSSVYLSSDESGNVLCINGRDMLVVSEADVDSVLNDILDAFEFYNDLGERLHELVADGRDVSDVLEEAGKAMGAMFVVADATYYIRFFGGDRSRVAGVRARSVLENRIMPLPVIMRINALSGIRAPVGASYDVDIPELGATCAVTNLFAGGRHEGWLVSVRDGDGVMQADLDAQDALVDIVAECLHRNAESDLRMDRASVLLEILEGEELARDKADERLATLGWNGDDRKAVYAVVQRDPSKNPHHVVGRFLQRIDPAALVLEHAGRTLVFADFSLTNEVAFEMGMRDVLSSCGCVAGKSPCFEDVTTALSQCRAAEIASAAASDRAPIVDFDGVKLQYALSLIKGGSVADVSHEALGVLGAYDASHDTQLKETLRVYLECACNATASAEALFIHRSTLLYRLERIVSLTGVDLGDAPTRFHLDLSYRLE